MALKSSTPRCGVYVIENTANGKVYVGSSKDVDGRWAEHRCALLHDSHVNGYLQRAWNKYGVNAFAFRFVRETPEAARCAAEAAEMRRYAPAQLYNLKVPSADALGLTHTEATRQKIRAAKLGVRRGPHSPEHRARISQSHLGLSNGPHTTEAREKIRQAQLGRPRSPETLAKLRQPRQLRPAQCGAGNPSARLTVEQVRLIRHLYAQGDVMLITLGRQFGVTPENIARIVRGETWVGV